MMLTLMLFREKEDGDDKKDNDQDMTVNIDFAEGTTTSEALAIKKNIRKTGAKDTKKLKHLQGLKQFYYGDFEVRVTKADIAWLKEDVTERMLFRMEDPAQATFHKLCKWLRKRNSIFDEMMDYFGDSYLAAIYPLKVRDAHSQLNRAFIPKQAKNRDTDKIAAYYRFTTTDLDLEADTFKEAISKNNYTKDECFINSIYDFYSDNLLRS